MDKRHAARWQDGHHGACSISSAGLTVTLLRRSGHGLGSFACCSHVAYRTLPYSRAGEILLSLVYAPLILTSDVLVLRHFFVGCLAADQPLLSVQLSGRAWPPYSIYLAVQLCR